MLIIFTWTCSTNNLDHEFTATRLEYYISGITLIEASGMEIPINDTIVALVSPHEEISTVVNLGAFEVSEIIGVRFHIGVPEALNHLDPTLYPEGHALGLHTESMHWSWATGYKFLAYDGTCGTDLTWRTCFQTSFRKLARLCIRCIYII